VIGIIAIGKAQRKENKEYTEDYNDFHRLEKEGGV